MRRYKGGARVKHKEFGWVGTVTALNIGWLSAVAVDWVGMTGYHAKDELRLL